MQMAFIQHHCIAASPPNASNGYISSSPRITPRSPLPSPGPASASCSSPLPLSFRSSALLSSRFALIETSRNRCAGAKVFPDVQRDRLPDEELRESLTTLFHLAIPVHDLQAAREFYGEILGCPEGRSAKTWVDFDLYGHQLTCHCIPTYSGESSANPVDGDPVPVPHFGLAMSVPNFLQLAERVKARDVKFIIEPHIRFKRQPGEQWTMFFKDRSGNSLEFKAMTNPDNVFAKYTVVD